jgi:hypothetical protein
MRMDAVWLFGFGQEGTTAADSSNTCKKSNEGGKSIDDGGFNFEG